MKKLSIAKSKKFQAKKDKPDHTPQQENDSDSFLDDIISGLTFPSLNQPQDDIPVVNLKEELEEDGVFPVIKIGDEQQEKIRELQAISASIEKKIISADNLSLPKGLKVNYAQELNPQQLAAVVTTDRPLLVIAGAGSGKTRVITYKVSYLIEQGEIPNEILLLTFTKKAAEEMLVRVQGLLADKSIKNVIGGTFHSFANNVLRRYGALIGIASNFSIIDTKDSEDIIDLLKTELKLPANKKSSPFPRKSKVQDIISKAKNLERSVTEIIEKYFEENTDHIPAINTIHRAYERYKKVSNLMDYDDLMIVLRDNLRDNEYFRQKLQSTIKHILVDEYQDTNNAQREIVEHLAGDNGRVTVVGDDCQSIYAFRGANFENILRFPQNFPNCGVVKIEENYRSEQGILDFINDVISHAQIGFQKRLFTQRHTGKKPTIKRFADGQDEAEYIVDKLLEIRNNEMDYSDFAVLTRASWHSNFVQIELTKRQIPYIVVGGIKFSEKRHIKDIIAFIKIILNPLDAVSWHRVLQLIEGVGKIRAKEIVDAIHKNSGKIDFSSFSVRKYYNDLQQLEGFLNKCINSSMSVPQMVQEIIDFYAPILQQVEDDYQVRMKDLEVLAVIAGKYGDLERFVTEFTLNPPSNRYQDRTTPMTEPDERPVIVSTIHSAKGLEWHTVFLPYALDGLMPSVKNINNVEELEEERRIFYVASSRAKENLFITMPAYIPTYDGVLTKPSRFIYDVDKDHYVVEP